MTTARNRTEPPVNRRLGFEAAPKEGLSREKRVDTDHDLARDKAQPMLTMMDRSQFRSLKPIHTDRDEPKWDRSFSPGSVSY